MHGADAALQTLCMLSAGDFSFLNYLGLIHSINEGFSIIQLNASINFNFRIRLIILVSKIPFSGQRNWLIPLQ
jgi:hypothetical protein